MDPGDADREELAERVEQLEQTVSKMLPDRRGVLKGLGAAAVGGAAVSGATGGASGQSAAGQVGTESEPVDVEGAQGNFDSVSTNQISNKASGRQIQAAQSGMVVPISDGLGIGDAIDPTNTTTCLVDAAKAIKNDGSGEGTVLLPSGNVEESTSDITSEVFIGGITFLGNSRGTGSRIRFTDTSDAPFKFTGGDQFRETRFHNVLLDGQDTAARQSAGGDATSSIIIRGVASQFELGYVQFANFGDRCVWFDTGHTYNANWDLLNFGFGSMPGRNLKIDNGDKSLQIDTIYGGPSTADPMVEVTVNGSVDFGLIDSGGVPTYALKTDLASSGFVTANRVNGWAEGSNFEACVQAKQNTFVNVAAVYKGTGDGFQKSGGFGDRIWIGTVAEGKGGTVDTPVVFPSGTDYTGGNGGGTLMPSSSVDTSATTLSEGFACIGDLSLKT